MLRIPYCLDNRLIDGGKVISLTHPPHFTHKKYYYYLLMLLVLISVRDRLKNGCSFASHASPHGRLPVTTSDGTVSQLLTADLRLLLCQGPGLPQTRTVSDCLPLNSACTSTRLSTVWLQYCMKSYIPRPCG
jgi:hypothetical protein